MRGTSKAITVAIIFAHLLTNVPTRAAIATAHSEWNRESTRHICWISQLRQTTVDIWQTPVKLTSPLLYHSRCVSQASRKAIIRCDARNSGLLFHVAPMQCYTNRHLRHLLRLLSARAVLWTEMEKVEDLLASKAARDRRLRHDDMEHPLVLQLGGSDPALLAEAARHARR